MEPTFVNQTDTDFASQTETDITSSNHACQTCDLEFKSRKERDNHILVTHGYKLKVYHLEGNETRFAFEKLDEAQREARAVLVESVNGELRCPDCNRKYVSPTTLNVHLRNKHNGFCLRIQPEERKHDEVDNTDADTDNSSQANISHSMDSISSSAVITSTSPSTSMENISTSSTSTLAASPSSTEEITSSSANTSTSSASKLKFIIPHESNHDAIVFKITDCMDKSEAEKKRNLLLVQLLGLKPMILEINAGEQFYMLMAQESIATLKGMEPGEYTCTFEIPEQRT